MDQIQTALTFSDVLLKPQLSSVQSRSQISLKTSITPKLSINFPIISINMDCVTGVDMAIAIARFGGMSFYPRFAPPEIQAKEVKAVFDAGFLTIPAVGIKPQEMDRVAALVSVGAKIITIDVAHAHQTTCLEFIKTLKAKYPELEIIAGVVGTYEGARDLFQAGADSVRVGVGPGTICTTRVMTGSGVPQITALLDAFKAAQEFGRPILSDGGTKNSGDIVKALAAGANAVVIGSQLAGASESLGGIIERDGRKFKCYNASTSKTEKVRQYQLNSSDKTADYVGYVEGIESLVPYRGPVEGILSSLEKGIRSGLSYSGAFNIDEFHNKA
ncbi:MAG TPA: guanosine monophosphate reductase, partial [Patescibacteria group bacterium]